TRRIVPAHRAQRDAIDESVRREVAPQCVDTLYDLLTREIGVDSLEPDDVATDLSKAKRPVEKDPTMAALIDRADAVRAQAHGDAHRGCPRTSAVSTTGVIVSEESTSRP